MPGRPDLATLLSSCASPVVGRSRGWQFQLRAWRLEKPIKIKSHVTSSMHLRFNGLRIVSVPVVPFIFRLAVFRVP